LRLALLREQSGNPLFTHPHPDASRRALKLTRVQLGTPGQVLLLATRRAAIVGMLRCREVRRAPIVAGSRHAMVTTAYVVPDERRSGVLRSLLAAADRWCRQRRLSGMRLHCALNNATGRKAWESLGFGAAELLYMRSIPSA
jgi:GNAT superfamily N-acetyltransferase